MPTSPRDLAGGIGWYQPTALFSNLRADEGHRPLREREMFAFHRGPFLTFRGPLHTRPCGATLSQERVRPHTRPGLCPGHPLPGEGFSPHPARAAPGPPSPEGKATSGGGMIPAASSGGVLQDQPFQGFFQVFLVYAGIIDDQAVQVCGLGIKGAEGLDLQALGEECLGQGFVRQACIHLQ